MPAFHQDLPRHVGYGLSADRRAMTNPALQASALNESNLSSACFRRYDELRAVPPRIAGEVSVPKSCFVVLLIAFSLGPVLASCAQDDESPSLGDVARQARLEKQRKDAPSANASATDKSGNAASQSTAANDSSADGSAINQAPVNSPSSKDAPSKSVRNETGSAPNGVERPKTSKSGTRVITNEDIASGIIAPSSSVSKSDGAQPASIGNGGDAKNPPEYWTNRILAQKNAIASLKSDIDRLSASIQYAPGNCVSGCVEWNENQQKKQQEVDSMKAQLQEQEKQLEDMQEAARQQGYGSAVYDP